MVAPIVNLNGTDKETLLDQLRDAAFAVWMALGKLTEAEPHARDYVQTRLGADGFKQAQKEHMLRLTRLKAVHGELLEIFQAVDNQ